MEGGRGDRGEGARKESERGKRKAQDEEDDEEEEGGGGRGRDGEAAARRRRREEPRSAVLGAGTQPPRDASFAWLAQPTATHPARCCARIYARPLAWGWRGAKGRAVW